MCVWLLCLAVVCVQVVRGPEDVMRDSRSLLNALPQEFFLVRDNLAEFACGGADAGVTGGAAGVTAADASPTDAGGGSAGAGDGIAGSLTPFERDLVVKLRPQPWLRRFFIATGWKSRLR